MNERLKNLMKRIGARIAQGAVIGVFLVFTLGLVMGTLLGGGDVSYAFLVRQYAAGFILVAVFNSMNILYEHGTMGLAQTTLVHFLVTFLAFVPLGFYASLLDSENVLMAFVIFILIYAGIWLGCYLTWKNVVDRIKSQLQNRP